MDLTILNLMSIIVGGGGLSLLIMGFFAGALLFFLIMGLLEVHISLVEAQKRANNN